MKTRKRQVRFYKDAAGHSPFEDWLDDLTTQARIKVQTRLDRAEAGNFGDFKSLKDGVFELRIHALAGLRVYYGLDGEEIILLLCGGTKRTQSKDVKKAKEYWREFLERRHKNVH